MERCESLPEREETSMNDEGFNQPLSALDQELHELIQQGLTVPANSMERRRKVNEIMRKMQQSEKLFCSSDPDYEDALMKTWGYFCRNLWEPDIVNNVEKPFSDRDCRILARFNAYLKKRLLDYQLQRKKEREKQKQSRLSDGERLDIAETIPAPQGCEKMQQLRELIEDDPTGELRQLHVRNRPQITAQILLMRRGLQETPWKVLAQEFGVSISTLNTFYERCLVLIKQLFDAN